MMHVPWDRLPLPGRRLLQHRVLTRCGPAELFAEFGYRFGEWAVNGRRAAPHYVAEVEGRLVEYLAAADGVGRRWGTAAGVAAGLLLVAVGGLAAWLWTVVR
ncbi:hypothetical protein Daura_09970 [Dactylosporangium aurantiacum]|uniref:Uncharacterized protein n=1 Tax=Dactylosporangium aurantiacum TaxID=35754 RepID=A0A9Q9IMC9_9ACTN|nr:hypothetical protein [Dactylosporangium aurantiacum]MDG6109361.1 hypothetical protein [Dactylosporangium aurantiacum]UWZ56467.1 hypothetical protein Daura_09970 [Dactylosporangium aurantiacum]